MSLCQQDDASLGFRLSVLFGVVLFHFFLGVCAFRFCGKRPLFLCFSLSVFCFVCLSSSFCYQAFLVLVLVFVGLCISASICLCLSDFSDVVVELFEGVYPEIWVSFWLQSLVHREILARPAFLLHSVHVFATVFVYSCILNGGFYFVWGPRQYFFCLWFFFFVFLVQVVTFEALVSLLDSRGKHLDLVVCMSWFLCCPGHGFCLSWSVWVSWSNF